jgi:Ca-activated chloride channel family protein
VISKIAAMSTARGEDNLASVINDLGLFQARRFPLMKRYLLSFVGCCLAMTSALGQVLTQQDVVKLLELKIPEQTIVEKVQSSGTAFVLGAEDIARLKKAGASDVLLAAMQSSSSSATAPGSESSEITDLALIIDYSGSMNAKMKDGATKVASAKKCMSDLIDKLPNDLNVALVVYGTSKQRGCESIDIVQPLGPINKAALRTKITGFNASGMTPIAASLSKAGEELKKAKGGSAIVLVTDGAESCHGDPAGVAAKLAAEFGVKFGINVIGFGIEPKEKTELANIAAKGHGKLVTVENAEELANALKKVVAEKVAATPAPTIAPTPTPTPTPSPRDTRNYEASGAAVKPGLFFGDAPVVKAGDYKGELAMKEAKYYQVMLHKGQELRAIGIIQKTPYEGGYYAVQTFVVAVYNKDLAQVAREKMDVDGNPADPATVRATWTAESDGLGYVAIGASDNHDKDGGPKEVYKPKDPKPSPYTLKIKIEGETADTGEQAASLARVATAGGAGFGSAAELKAPSLATSDLKIDETAFYKFPVKKGDPVQVSAAIQKPWYNAMMSGGIKATFTLTLYDDDQVQVGQKKITVENNPPDPQSLSVNWSATTSGSAYASVSATNSGGAIYPAQFQPGPGRFSVQVTTGDLSPPAVTGEKPVESTSSPESSGTATPTEKKSEDAFSGAESTPQPR